mmetsp:Transcript_148378/g.413378  ORF Transcript_148378/g.413378 Transcript_148378/m.413378 type:complete len:206 (-) Transcript_148378:119-736(-)
MLAVELLHPADRLLSHRLHELQVRAQHLRMGPSADRKLLGITIEDLPARLLGDRLHHLVVPQGQLRESPGSVAERARVDVVDPLHARDTSSSLLFLDLVTLGTGKHLRDAAVEVLDPRVPPPGVAVLGLGYAVERGDRVDDAKFQHILIHDLQDLPAAALLDDHVVEVFALQRLVPFARELILPLQACGPPVDLVLCRFMRLRLR